MKLILATNNICSGVLTADSCINKCKSSPYWVIQVSPLYSFSAHKRFARFPVIAGISRYGWVSRIIWSSTAPGIKIKIQVDHRNRIFVETSWHWSGPGPGPGSGWFVVLEGVILSNLTPRVGLKELSLFCWNFFFLNFILYWRSKNKQYYENTGLWSAEQEYTLDHLCWYRNERINF